MLTSKDKSYTYLNTIENLLQQKLQIKFINSNGELVGINKQSHRFEIFNRADVRMDNYIGLLKISKSDASKCGNPQLLKNLYLENLSDVNRITLQKSPLQSALLACINFNWLSLDDVQKILGNQINDKRYLTIQSDILQVRMQTMTKEVEQLNKAVKNFNMLSNIVLGKEKESEI